MTKRDVIFICAVGMAWLGCCSSPHRLASVEWRVLPLGDSITHGKDGDGYRPALSDFLARRGVSVKYVGGLNDGRPLSAHEGRDGALIQHLLGDVGDVMHRHHPDVVLLMIGANDIEARFELDGMTERYRELLEKLTAVDPAARILVGEITLIRIAEFDDLARDFNPKLREIVGEFERRGQKVTFVPMHDVLALADLDQVDHPDRNGNAKIARRWAEYLRSEPVVKK